MGKSNVVRFPEDSARRCATHEETEDLRAQSAQAHAKTQHQLRQICGETKHLLERVHGEGKKTRAYVERLHRATEAAHDDVVASQQRQARMIQVQARSIGDLEGIVGLIHEDMTAGDQKVMNELGKVVHAVLDTDAKSDEAKQAAAQAHTQAIQAQRDAAQAFSLASQVDRAAATVIVRHQDELRQVKSALDGDIAQVRRDFEQLDRSLRVFQTLPEMKVTRAAVLFGQGLSDGLATLLRPRLAKFASAFGLIVVVLMAANAIFQYRPAAAATPAPVAAPAPEEFVSCVYYNHRTGETSSQRPLMSTYVGLDLLYVLKCGQDVRFTPYSSLPANGLFNKKSLVR